MDPLDEQPDSHAAARERREAKLRHGMRESGRSTRSLPDLIVRRGRDASERLRKLAKRARPGRADDDEDE